MGFFQNLFNKNNENKLEANKVGFAYSIFVETSGNFIEGETLTQAVDRMNVLSELGLQGRTLVSAKTSDGKVINPNDLVESGVKYTLFVSDETLG